MASWQYIDPFIRGAVASGVAEVVTFPLDLTKTRLQIQGQVLDTNYKQLRYKSIHQTIATVAREEGLLGLYSGLGPAVLRQLIYGGLKRGLYLSFQNVAGTKSSKKSVFFQNFLLSAASGGISAVVCNPIDILKVRMQTNGTLFSATVSQLWKIDGAKGLFRAVGPNIIRTSMLVGTTFSIYDEMSRILYHKAHWERGLETYLVSSFSAAIVGSLVTNPFEVAKSRMMNQHQHGIRYRNLFHCLYETLATEGPRALMKGYSSSLCRSVPWQFTFFMLNEYL